MISLGRLAAALPAGSARRPGEGRPTDRLMDAIRKLDLDTWTPAPAADGGAALARDLEAGRVLYLPRLGFAVLENEQRFLDPRWSDGAAKNISLEKDCGAVRGAAGSPEDLN